MNAILLAALGNYPSIDFALICKTLVWSLGHTIWQAALMAVIVVGVLRIGWLTVHQKYRLALSTLFLIGCFPLVNFFWLSQYSTPLVELQTTPLAKYDVAKYDVANYDVANYDVANYDSKKYDENRFSESFSLSANEIGEEVATYQQEPDSDSLSVTKADLALNEPPRSTHFDSVGNFDWSWVYQWLVAAYLIGLVVMGWRLYQGISGQRSLWQIAEIFQWQPLNDLQKQSWASVKAAADRAARRVGWRGQVQIGLIHGSIMAVVAGCLRPIILVNGALITGLTPRQLEQVIAHELVHLIRRDPWALLAQRLIEMTQFFNPVMWFVSRQVSTLRELCCDQQVAQRYGAVEYAQTLVECVAWERHARHPLALAVTGFQGSEFRHRISVLLDLPLANFSVSTELNRWSGWWGGRKSNVKLSSFLIGFGMLIAGLVVAFGSRQESEPAAILKPDWPWRTDVNDRLDRTRMAFQSRRLPLSNQMPAGLEVEAMVDPTECWFAQWQFGDSRSRSVTLMVEMIAGRPNRLFLDRNRDQIIDDSERLPLLHQDDEIWTSDLPVEILYNDDIVQMDRQVAIDFTSDLKSVRIATLGFAEGIVKIVDRELLCRRIDNDGNGIPLGAGDDLWIDLNGDQEFDPVSERFKYAPWIEIAGVKYGLQSDPLGQDLKLTPAPALGQVKFLMNLSDPEARIIDLQGTFRDRWGNFVPLRMDQLTAEVLPGEYCIESLVVTVVDHEGETWFITMSHGFEMDWFEVESELSTEIDLMAKPTLHAIPEFVLGFYGKSEAGFTPYLIGPSGLIVTDFKRGHTETVQMVLKLSRPDGRSVDGLRTITCSGFG